MYSTCSLSAKVVEIVKINALQSSANLTLPMSSSFVNENEATLLQRKICDESNNMPKEHDTSLITSQS